MTTTTFGISVIGLGRWGPNHVRNFNAMTDCRVVAAADPVASCRERVRGACPSITMYDNAHAAITRQDVDAVVISTPTASHYEIAREALEAGKHVLCEKPLATLSKDAWELGVLAKRVRRQLMVGHVFLYNPGIEFLSRAVKDGIAGNLYYINAIRTNLGPFRYDVNAAWDLASHDIYILNHLVGANPTAVAAAGGSYLKKPIEDIVFLTLLYPSGVMGHVHVSWLDPRKVRQITVVGEKKMILWDDLGVPGPIMMYDRQVTREPTYHTFGEFQLLAREGDVVLPRIPSQEPLLTQARAFVARCLKGDADERGTARQGAEVVDILAAVSRSLANNGTRTEVQYEG